MGRKKDLPLLRDVVITDIGAEGNAIARVNDIVLFVPGMIPGDVCDVKVKKKKNRYMEGVAVRLSTPSSLRITPPCVHFGECGGCRWQHLPYERQLYFKEKQVRDNLTRIGHNVIPEVSPIIASDLDYRYRNKLEFTFARKRWITKAEALQGGEITPGQALGFHIPGIFDKVLDIEQCHLMPEPVNAVRNGVRRFAVENEYLFYDQREHTGFLRNLVVRITTTGEVMVVLAVAADDEEGLKRILDYMLADFPGITSLWYVINTKKNDSLSDQLPLHYAGSRYITEEMDNLRFRVGPKSFYQTNSRQASKLYGVVREFAQLTGKENLYDLYTGTGTIACYLASGAEKVTGIEYIEEAVADARENALLNNIDNTFFISGDIKDVLGEKLFLERGYPDVIVTDPPRAGMHEDVTRAIIASGASRVVYVSCNPATQARDLAMLSERYSVKRVQPVDMFPQTFHVENVCLLEKMS